MAARLVSSVRTTRVLRGCCSRYFLTVFFDSPTLMVSTTRPLAENSSFNCSTSGASWRQYPHQVVQNSRSTTLPLRELLLNFSPAVVVALKFGAASLGFDPALIPKAMRTSPQRTVP